MNLIAAVVPILAGVPTQEDLIKLFPNLPRLLQWLVIALAIATPIMALYKMGTAAQRDLAEKRNLDADTGTKKSEETRLLTERVEQLSRENAELRRQIKRLTEGQDSE